MNIKIDLINLSQQRFDAIVLYSVNGQITNNTVIEEINKITNNSLNKIIKINKLTDNDKKLHIIYTSSEDIKKIIIVNIRKTDNLDMETIRMTGGDVSSKIKELELNNYGIIIPKISKLNYSDFAQSLVEGSKLALYDFNNYKTTKSNNKKSYKLNILIEKDVKLEEVKKGVKIGQAVVEGVEIARDIANTPGCDCTPNLLAKKVKEITNKHNLNYEIIDEENMKKLKMGGILGVSSGSSETAKLIIIKHNNATNNVKPIIIVGKAVTFDSGGISIKPSSKMEEMKYDKSGGATVIGTMVTVAKLNLPMNIIGVIPATENLPGGRAYKPGDILKFSNGKTAEIINTDAEGRVILGDALYYSTRWKPQAIIDLATLTGACIVALGNSASGLMGNNQKLIDKIIKAGNNTCEKVWQLPMWEEYTSQIKSDVADIRNTGIKGAGTITAAAFLAEFVEKYPWAHLDIAGTAWIQETTPKKSYLTKGATGICVRLLTNLLQNWKN